MEQLTLFDINLELSDDIVVKLGEMPKIIISLFEHSGFASYYWRKAGYQVIQIDTKLGIDIFSWDYKSIPIERVVGIMAFPDCTDFTISGCQYWEQKDKDGRTDYSVRMVNKTIEIIEHFSPKWWYLENPVGRIATLVPWLQNYGPWYIQPYEFGDPWKKKTGIYGKFKVPDKKIVKPILQKKYHSKYKKKGFSYYSWTHFAESLLGKVNRKEVRSYTPLGFSKAFYKANHNC